MTAAHLKVAPLDGESSDGNPVLPDRVLVREWHPSKGQVPSAAALDAAVPRNGDNDTSLHPVAAKAMSRGQCGRGAIIGVNSETGLGKIIPLTCKQWGCPKCRVRKGRQWVEIVRCGKPQRMITLTCPPDKYDTVEDAIRHLSKAFSKMVARIRRKFGEFEYVRVWEMHKSGWPHMHILQRGCFIPQKWLSESWEACGGGPIVHIEYIRGEKNAAAYIVKYLGKQFADLTADMPGLRLINKSRNWVIEKSRQTRLMENVEYTWIHVKAPYWNIVSDLAVANVRTLGDQKRDLVIDLDFRQMHHTHKIQLDSCLPFDKLLSATRPPG